MTQARGPVSIGFVGCGTMGQLAHLANFATLDGCRVVALAERRPKLRELVAAKHGIERTYDTHADLLLAPDIEAVVSITSHSLNDQIVPDLLRAGKHVMTEKPMANSLAGAQKIVEAAEDGGAKTMVGYMKRYDAGVQMAKGILDELVQTGRLGKITFVRAHCFGGEWLCNIGEPIQTDEPYPAATPSPHPEWLPKALEEKYHWINNVFCHNINLIRFLLGEPTVNHVDLRKAAGVILLEFEGFLCSLEAGQITANHWEEHTQIYFEDGWLRIDTPSPLLRNIPARVELYEAGTTQRISHPQAEWSWAFRRQAEHFVQCVAEDQEPLSSGRDSLRDMEILEAIFGGQLAAEGGWLGGAHTERPA